jgi:signal transduction histidine kinase
MNPQSIPMTAETYPESQSVDRFRLRRPWLTLARVIWGILCIVTIVMVISAVWGTYVYFGDPQRCTKGFPPEQADCLANAQALHSFGLPIEYFGIHSALGVIVEAFPMILVGFLIFSRKSSEPFGILFSLNVVVSGTIAFDNAIHYFYKQVWSSYPVLGAVGDFMLFLGNVLIIAWYLFPNGRFVPGGTRWLALAWMGIQFLAFFFPGSLLDRATWPELFLSGTNYLLAGSLAYSLIYRYRHVSDGVQRQQIKWVVASGMFYVLIFIIDPRPFMTPGLSEVLRSLIWTPFAYLSGAFIAVSIAFSILRYRLWDIDLIINRALVYGALTVSIIGMYVLVVGALGMAMQSHVNWLVSILATGLIAVLVQPLRDRLQRWVNRLMYGERDDPITVLSRLGKQLESTLAPDAVLPSLVGTIAQQLKLPYVAIEMTMEDHLANQGKPDPALIPGSPLTIAYGNPQPDVICFPLIYQSKTIGQLLVAPRASGEAFNPMDRHLLENIARQAGMAVHAVSLTADLQRSRQRLVTTREEERRRLRRDLHDGLGPNLASQGLKLAAVKHLLEKDPTSAIPLLEQVMNQNQSTVDEVRRLVYGLRPPALDELGLVAAIRDHVAGMDGKFTLQKIEIKEPPEGLPPLSAAVEVAAYRIVLEALTNVIRHAQAQHCMIRFSLHQMDAHAILQVEIQDDGIGLSSTQRAGVGTRSMRERAEELGGTCVIESIVSGGTHLSVRIPLIVV